MSRHTTGEDVRSTASERALGFLLSVFILIGLAWAYTKIGDHYFKSGEESDTAWILRLALILVCAAIGTSALVLMRRRQSRYVPVGWALLTATALLAIWFLGDYTELSDDGLLALSLIGIVICLAGFYYLQRSLRKRIPLRRVRRGECPFCGFPARADANHCEGCGRLIAGECNTCHQRRRIGTPYCSSCGSA